MDDINHCSTFTLEEATAICINKEIPFKFKAVALLMTNTPWTVKKIYNKIRLIDVQAPTSVGSNAVHILRKTEIGQQHLTFETVEPNRENLYHLETGRYTFGDVIKQMLAAQKKVSQKVRMKKEKTKLVHQEMNLQEDSYEQALLTIVQLKDKVRELDSLLENANKTVEKLTIEVKSTHKQETKKYQARIKELEMEVDCMEDRTTVEELIQECLEKERRITIRIS